MIASSEADIVFEQISGDYAVWERAVREAAPELPDSEIRDRALRSVLAQFRYDLSKETFATLRERLERARHDGLSARDAALSMRERTRELRAVSARFVETSHRGITGTRTFRDSAGRVWTVRELRTDDISWARGRSCLVFASEMAVRRVWGVVPGWRNLSETELERLSWRR